MSGRGEVTHICVSYTREGRDGVHASSITFGHRMDVAAPSPLFVRCTPTPLQNSCRKPGRHSHLQRDVSWARREASLAASSPRHRHDHAVPLARNMLWQSSLLIFRRPPSLHAWPPSPLQRIPFLTLSSSVPAKHPHPALSPLTSHKTRTPKQIPPLFLSP